MPLPFPPEFIRTGNFQLAWERIKRGNNAWYKDHFRFLFPSYEFAIDSTLGDLRRRVSTGLYQPSHSVTIYAPKATRVLRPIGLLTLDDQVVYQAIANYIADRVYPALSKNYGVRTFGAQYSGQGSPYFYSAWKRGYRDFNSAIRSAFNRGNTAVADFDLVSFYDLIDHKVLRWFLNKLALNGEVLDLLFRCLEKWTSRDQGMVFHGHGIPQGPLPSPLLAEVMLHDFDCAPIRDVSYFRYIDDIKMLAKDQSRVRRALVHLDLLSKRVGLVPQAQKIAVRDVTDIEAELKTIPSAVEALTSKVVPIAQGRRRIKSLEVFLRSALQVTPAGVAVISDTHFKYSIYRMPPRKRILKLLAPLFHSRPDLSSALSTYAKRFGSSAASAALLRESIKSDPVFDATAGDFISALDVCAVRPIRPSLRRAVRRVIRRSQEKSVLLNSPAQTFLCHFRNSSAIARVIRTSADPVTTAKLINNVVAQSTHPEKMMRRIRRALTFHAQRSDHSDLSRYCTFMLMSQLAVVPRNLRPPGAILAGKASVVPQQSFLATFFKEMFNVRANLPWSKLLGKRAHVELQRRAIVIRGAMTGSPSVMISMLDNFNDLLLQRFSKKEPTLKGPYLKAARKSANPDYGFWLAEPPVAALLPRAHPVLVDCHALRVKAEVAHATSKKTGKFTRPVTFSERNRIIRRFRLGYLEWILQWRKL